MPIRALLSLILAIFGLRLVPVRTPIREIKKRTAVYFLGRLLG